MQATNRLNSGFTLIEVMITVAVIGILAAIALPTYSAYVLRSHRAEARNALLSAAQKLEQNYTLSGAYNVTQTGGTVNTAFLVAAGLDLVPESGATRYNLSFASSQPTASTFVLQAIPTGQQTADTECGTLLLNQQNLKGAVGVLDNRATATRNCWSR